MSAFGALIEKEWREQQLALLLIGLSIPIGIAVAALFCAGDTLDSRGAALAVSHSAAGLVAFAIGADINSRDRRGAANDWLTRLGARAWAVQAAKVAFLTGSVAIAAVAGWLLGQAVGLTVRGSNPHPLDREDLLATVVLWVGLGYWAAASTPIARLGVVSVVVGAVLAVACLLPWAALLGSLNVAPGDSFPWFVMIAFLTSGLAAWVLPATSASGNREHLGLRTARTFFYGLAGAAPLWIPTLAVVADVIHFDPTREIERIRRAFVSADGETLLLEVEQDLGNEIDFGPSVAVAVDLAKGSHRRIRPWTAHIEPTNPRETLDGSLDRATVRNGKWNRVGVETLSARGPSSSAAAIGIPTGLSLYRRGGAGFVMRFDKAASGDQRRQGIHFRCISADGESRVSAQDCARWRDAVGANTIFHLYRVGTGWLFFSDTGKHYVADGASRPSTPTWLSTFGYISVTPRGHVVRRKHSGTLDVFDVASGQSLPIDWADESRPIPEISNAQSASSGTVWFQRVAPGPWTVVYAELGDSSRCTLVIEEPTDSSAIVHRLDSIHETWQEVVGRASDGGWLTLVGGREIWHHPFGGGAPRLAFPTARRQRALGGRQ